MTDLNYRDKTSHNSTPIRRMLVRGTNWIGDSVMSVAALRELRKLYPDAHLAILLKQWVAGVFEGQGLVDEIIVLADNESVFSRLRAAGLAGFDVAVLFQNAFEAALISFLARIPERVGYSTQWRGFLLTRRAGPRIRNMGRHQVFYYLDLLYQTGLSPVDYLHSPSFRPDIRLSPSEQGLKQSSQLLSQINVDSKRCLVGLNPGAFFGPAKRWLTDRYAALADRLIRELGAEILIFGSQEEKTIAAEIENNMARRPTILAGRTSLSTLMGLISMCDLFVTNDSGPMHLAAALGTPLLAIFGSTDKIATGPVGEKARVIHKHVDCSPCLLRKCPIDLRCFHQIEVDEVFETAKELLIK